MEMTGMAYLPEYGVKWSFSLMNEIYLGSMETPQRWLMAEEYIAVLEGAGMGEDGNQAVASAVWPLPKVRRHAVPPE